MEKQNKRYLTKSRFKLGLECPNKLYYTRKPEYADQKQEDPFLLALADGGFQVEEVARMMYPGGILLDEDMRDYDALWRKTQELMLRESVIIYEASFLFENLFIRTDILVKRGDHIKLIEVKSKSFDSSDDHNFLGSRGGIVSKWLPYFQDLAFQKYVLQKCFPSLTIVSYLLLANKTAVASINGMNQMFRIPGDSKDKRSDIIKKVSDIAELGDPVLSQVNVDHIIDKIMRPDMTTLEGKNFTESIDYLSDLYASDTYAACRPNNFTACKKCEFKATPEEITSGKKSGKEKCFREKLNWKDHDFDRPNIFDIWDMKRGNSLMAQGLYFKDQLSQDDLKYKDTDCLISRTERQWIQIIKDLEKTAEPHVLREELADEMSSWVFPLHFIDFETNTAALPFHRGRSPYEQIAFQFSHHIYHEDGRIEHANEYISNVAGEFPNFHFIRALKEALCTDEGTIFRFAPHENTVLNVIYNQLQKSQESDREDLMNFIQHITYRTEKKKTIWRGKRAMVDLCQVVIDYYYNPLTNGSNSLKYVLPAILATDKALQEKYTKPIDEIGLKSKNFSGDHVWLIKENDQVINPYKRLPAIFDDWSEEDVEEALSGLDELADGGAAMMAYSKLQYVNISDAERQAISDALLKYCELDTLAMVMVYEHFRNLV